MPKLTIYPLGNADCCQIDLANGQKLLFDYANKADPCVPPGLQIDLDQVLQADLKADSRNDYDVVAISHLDNDHICGAPGFFHLEHSSKYQGSDRVRIQELWVPAAVIIDDECDDDAKIIQAEARYRLRMGKGIRIFSSPDLLKEWLGKEGIALADRSGIITDAGKTVPDFTKEEHGVEFFVHSPFATRVNETEVVNRNKDCLVLQATFACDGQESRLILGADVEHEVLSDIVAVTRWHKRDERLSWDIFKLPHHCSYLSLSSEKGTEKTKPVPEVKWLFEQGTRGGIIVSTSRPIPSEDTSQPPHRQAANYYKERATKTGGTFKVTMEHPEAKSPAPLVIVIDGSNPSIQDVSNDPGGKSGGPSIFIKSSRDVREAPPFA